MNMLPGPSVRVRFAPSPTGHLHIGGLRAAIFNWLFARHHQGSFLLRIEDTDMVRSRQEYTDSIISSLAWCGLTPDENMVIQSQRLAVHKQALNDLLVAGKIYRCYCTTHEHAQRSGQVYDEEQAFARYDGHCRFRTDHPDKPFAVRFALPNNIAEISFIDMIRGKVTFSLDQFDDFVIARSDGYPLYNFVVVVDDATMGITHVIRGEEHLPNTPKQILLYEALGYALPQFAHAPVILGPDGSKLSKRDGAASVLEYKELGYLPEALVNYLVRLGWAHGDQEIFSYQELITYFSLDQVGKKGAIFDKEKLDWLNGVYVRSYTPEALYTYIEHHMMPDFAQRSAPLTYQQCLGLLKLYQERVRTVKELIEIVLAVREVPTVYAEEVTGLLDKQTAAYLQEVDHILRECQEFTPQVLTVLLKQWCKEKKQSLVAIAQPLRFALTGKSVSPSVFELLALLGKEESRARIQILISRIIKG